MNSSILVLAFCQITFVAVLTGIIGFFTLFIIHGDDSKPFHRRSGSIHVNDLFEIQLMFLDSTHFAANQIVEFNVSFSPAISAKFELPPLRFEARCPIFHQHTETIASFQYLLLAGDIGFTKHPFLTYETSLPIGKTGPRIFVPLRLENWKCVDCRDPANQNVTLRLNTFLHWRYEEMSLMVAEFVKHGRRARMTLPEVLAAAEEEARGHSKYESKVFQIVLGTLRANHANMPMAVKLGDFLNTVVDRSQERVKL